MSGSPLVVPNVPDGLYYLRVLAVDGDGSSVPSDEVTLAVSGGASTPGPCTSPPGAPQNLTLGVAANLVTLNWAAPTLGCPAASFVVQAGSAPGLSDVTVANVGAATSLAAFAPDNRYFIRVLALNAFGGSSPSNEVVALVGNAQSNVVVYSNATDTGLARVTMPDGARVEYLGDKNGSGFATQLRRLELSAPATQSVSAYEFDSSGRPTVMEAAGIRTNIVWTSATTGTVAVRSSSGEILAAGVPLRVSGAAQLSTGGAPSNLAFAASGSAGQFVRVRDACSQPVNDAAVHVQTRRGAANVVERFPAAPQDGGLYRAEIPLPDPLAGENLRIKCDTASSVAASLPCSRVAIGIVVAVADAIAIALAASGAGLSAAAAVAQASTLYGAHMTTACRAAGVIGAACELGVQALDRGAGDGDYTIEGFAFHQNLTYASAPLVVPATGPFTQVLPIDVPCNRSAGLTIRNDGETPMYVTVYAFLNQTCGIRTCTASIPILGNGALQPGKEQSVDYAPLRQPGSHTLRVAVQGYGAPGEYTITLPNGLNFTSIATDFGAPRFLSGFVHSDVLDPFGRSGDGVHMYTVTAR